MTYSHIKQPGLLLVMLLAGVVSYFNNSHTTLPHSVSVGYAKHGLRAYVDPDTGQFGRPPKQSAQSTDAPEPSFSAQAFIKRPTSVTLSEQASAKAGGGYSIELRERYRPSRHGSQQGVQGS